MLNVEGKQFQKINNNYNFFFQMNRKPFDAKTLGKDEVSFYSCADLDFSFVPGNMMHYSCKQNVFVLRLCRGTKKKLMAKLREGVISAML